MKSAHCFLLFLTALVAGCVAGNSTLNQSKAASLTHIQIVPIEGPPLSGLDLSSVGGGQAIGSSGLAMLGGVLMLVDDPEADARSAAASQSIGSLLDKNEIWEPTVEIAKETLRQLETASSNSVSVNSEVQPLPGVKRKEATLLMENWLVPIKDWYNMDITPFSYSEQPSSAAVLEVGLSNYELSGGRFFIQIMMKLVNPASRLVVANARCYSYPEVGDVEKLFEGDAAGYKQVFRKTTAALVAECIEELGLLKT